MRDLYPITRALTDCPRPCGCHPNRRPTAETAACRPGRSPDTLALSPCGRRGELDEPLTLDLAQIVSVEGA